MLHNCEGGLGLRIERKDGTGDYITLAATTLKKLKKNFKDLKLVIIDEFSMIHQHLCTTSTCV